MLEKMVLSNGKLNGKYVQDREILYQGMNGKNVERFYLSASESYIFKPLTNDSQLGKEQWIYEYVLPSLPPFYPKMIAKSSSTDPDNHWMIFEDLGSLNHVFNEKVVLEVIKCMAKWHTVPTDNLKHEDLHGPKPYIEDITADVFANKQEILRIASEHSIPKRYMDIIFLLLEENPFSNVKVFSHGDLHLGNYAVTDQQVVVLDWEHAHLNVPFWDLYHLMDMSHPMFPKEVTPILREHVLGCYLDQMAFYGLSFSHHSFKQEYYLFSTVFSLWMLLLIQQDLNNGNSNWPKERLREQLNETISNLVQCANQLS